MTAEASKQSFVMAIFRASLSHLSETIRSPTGSRHLQHQIGVMRDSHKPGQHGGPRMAW
jgi:hypothetical protein